MENEAYALPDLSSTPVDESELVEKHLRPRYKRYMSERRTGQAEVNAGLPHMNPWELIPEVARQARKGKAHKDQRRREKYFLTTGVDKSESSLLDIVDAPQGSWRPQGPLGWVIWDKSNSSSCVGRKMTYDFYTRTKTNWIMNVYSLIDNDYFIQNEMVLCHVFENNSPDYDPRPECATSHPYREHLAELQEFERSKQSCGSCSYEHSGKPCNEAIHRPRRSSFRRTAPGSLSTHHGSDPPSDPRLTSWMAHFEKVLLGDDPEISTDAEDYNPSGGGTSSTVMATGDEDGQSRKRAKTRMDSQAPPKSKSDVWQHFTKIFAHGPDGVVVTLAACKHCCKVLTGDSKNGTSHLRRHKCPCNLKRHLETFSCKMHLNQPSQVLCHSVDRGDGHCAALAPMLEGNQQGNGRRI